MINLFRSDESKHQKAQNYRSIYDKPKSLIRAFTQELFLKILFKLFPEKFSSYKNKIRFVMNRGAYHIYLFSISFYLRFRYPRYFIFPSEQIYALHKLIRFLEILKPQKIDFFLVGGCLLGAVRQGSFAGRPSDIDLGIKEDQLPQLLEAIPLIIESGARFIRKRPNADRIEKLQILYPCFLVDVGIYRKKNMKGKELWIENTERYGTWSSVDQKYDGFLFALDPLIPIKVYGRKFLAPSNPEIYLEKKYGKNWKIPDKKQFFFEKNKFK
jgi:hypothetical protein|tara:strand:+ start:1126 stop:1935 length:810 start_codon:yes stop_codon:yes gene_type:complete